MRFLATLLFCPLLVAQTFRIVPSMAPGGGGGSLLVTLSSPPGKEPVAAQWKITLGAEVTAAAGDIVVGDAATAAGKSVTCAPAAKTGQNGLTYACILVGGGQHIANGTITLVKYKVKPNTAPQVLAVRISDGLAVLEEAGQLRQVTVPAADGTITVR
jgi:hypothetical protein